MTGVLKGVDVEISEASMRSFFWYHTRWLVYLIVSAAGCLILIYAFLWFCKLFQIG